MIKNVWKGLVVIMTASTVLTACAGSKDGGSGKIKSNPGDFINVDYDPSDNSRYAVAEEAVGEHPYPAEMMAFTDEDKRAQAAAAQKLVMQIGSAHTEGKKEFQIQPGYYRFGGFGAKNFMLADMTDFKITGGPGVHFIQTTTEDCIILRNCANVEIAGVTIDYDPLPFFQGTITFFDVTTSEIRFSMDSDYEEYYENLILDDPGLVDSAQRVLYFDKDDDKKAISPITEGAMFGGVEKLDNGEYTIHYKDDKLTELNADLEAGDRIAVPMRAEGNAIFVTGGERLLLKNIDVYAAPLRTVLEMDTVGGNVYSNIRTIRRPGTDRLVTVAGDSFHMMNIQYGPTIDRCEISYSQDDGINIHGMIAFVQKKISDREFIVVFPLTTGLDAHSELSFFELVGHKSLGKAKVTSVEAITSGEDYDKAPQFDSTMKNNLPVIVRTFDRPSVYRIKLDADVKAKEFDGVSSPYYSAPGTVIRNCYIHDTNGTGIRLHGPDSLIENNIFRRVNTQTVAVDGGGMYSEGPLTTKLRIINNLFDSNSQAVESQRWPGVVTMFAQPYVFPWVMSETDDTITDIEVSGNEFINNNANAIFAYNVNGLKITDNKVSGCYTKPLISSAKDLNTSMGLIDVYYGIFVDHSQNVTFQGNTFGEQGDHCLGDYRIGENTKNVIQ